MSLRRRTSPDVTLTMNCGAVFRRSLAGGRMVQTRQLPPERFTNQSPWDYPASPYLPPVPRPDVRPVQAIEVLDVDV
jgi:hypothetical protein